MKRSPHLINIFSTHFKKNIWRRDELDRRWIRASWSVLHYWLNLELSTHRFRTQTKIFLFTFIPLCLLLFCICDKNVVWVWIHSSYNINVFFIKIATFNWHVFCFRPNIDFCDMLLVSCVDVSPDIHGCCFGGLNSAPTTEPSTEDWSNRSKRKVDLEWFEDLISVGLEAKLAKFVSTPTPNIILWRQ